MTGSFGDPPGPEGPRKFGFRPIGEESGARNLPVDQPRLTPLEEHGPSAHREVAPPYEISWFLAMICGFGGSLAGGLLGVPGGPVLGCALAFAPLWLRVMRSGKVSTAALAAVAWMIGCIGAGAGMGAEGSAARFAGAVPLAPAYLALVPLAPVEELSGFARWPSLIPGLLCFWVVAGLGRFAQALPAVFLAAVPISWISARAARFTAAALVKDWEPGTALFFGAPPQHLLVLGGALAVACVLASPRGGYRFPPEGTAERHVYTLGLGAGLVGLLAEPWISSLWRSFSTL